MTGSPFISILYSNLKYFSSAIFYYLSADTGEAKASVEEVMVSYTKCVRTVFINPGGRGFIRLHEKQYFIRHAYPLKTNLSC